MSNEKMLCLWKEVMERDFKSHSKEEIKNIEKRNPLYSKCIKCDGYSFNKECSTYNSLVELDKK